MDAVSGPACANQGYEIAPFGGGGGRSKCKEMTTIKKEEEKRGRARSGGLDKSQPRQGETNWVRRGMKLTLELCVSAVGVKKDCVDERALCLRKRTGRMGGTWRRGGGRD